ncbi:MAG: hypothetical protein K0S32_4441 [Bacteroidetes bacterium]|jgi:hypothetical protein|nr:hypothetical protein [Bacteroidota bacterium]
MKKFIIVCLGVAFGIVSCEKERTCTCTVTKTGTSTTKATITVTLTASTLIPIPLPPLTIDTTFSSPVSESETVDRKIEKTKKKYAEAGCLSYTEPYTENTYNVVPSFTLNTTNKGEKTYKCELK